MKKLILILGGGNDENGNLNNMSLDRIQCALNLYNSNDNISILCTGGFGENFNTTKSPHALYVQTYLLDKGVKEENLLEPVISCNTVEDFRLAKPIIENCKPDLLITITSDFHMERVKILQKLILDFRNTLFIPAFSSLPKEELTARIVHEQKAIQILKNNHYKLY